MPGESLRRGGNGVQGEDKEDLLDAGDTAVKEW